MKHLSGIWIAALILIMAGCDDNSKSPSDNGMPTHCPTTCINGCNPDGSCKDGKAECPDTCTNGCNPDGSCKDSKAECPDTCTNGCNPDGSCLGNPTAECTEECTNGCDEDGSCINENASLCPDECKYGCDERNVCLDLYKVYNGDHCSHDFSTCKEDTFIECNNNTIAITNCHDDNLACILADSSASCAECKQGYDKNGICLDNEANTFCSDPYYNYCKDNILFRCVTNMGMNRFNVTNCNEKANGRYLTCVYNEYRGDCLDLCTEEEFNTHAEIYRCDEEHSQHYYCYESSKLSGFYEWIATGKRDYCPEGCLETTGKCKPHQGTGIPCNSDHSAPDFYNSRCDQNYILLCDSTDNLVISHYCGDGAICVEYDGDATCQFEE